MNALERAVNEVSDKDWNWWPFLWLRPAQHERLSLRRLASMAVLYGLPLGGVLALALGRTEARAQAPFVLALVPLFMFFLASVIIGPMWNRRAARLRR